MRANDGNPANLPLPPPELMARIGQQRPADKEKDGELSVAEWYLLFGRRLKESVMEILPGDFDLTGARVLDFGCGSGRVLRHFTGHGCELWGCDLDTESVDWLQANLAGSVNAFENPPAPPIDLAGGSFDLILALSVFTHLTEDWSDWLLELHRLVKPGGYVVVSFIGPGMAGQMTGETLTEDDIGMNAIGLGRGFDRDSGPIVFHSHWWLHAHWGRAFEIVSLQPDRIGRPHAFSQGAVLMRRREVDLSRDDLEWPVDDPRELRARRVNTRQLREEAKRERRRYVNEGRRKAEARFRRAGVNDSSAVTPILVDCVGRGGSTLLMQLLRSSLQVIVEGPFPYERRYFAYFHHWARLLGESDWPKDTWNNPELARGARWNHSLIGPPPWGPDPLLTSSGPPMTESMIRAAWDDFSRRLLAAHENGRPTHYAEKSVDTHRLDLRLIPEARLLVLVRDPRDTFVSIEAFNAKRERTDFGRGESSDEEFLEAFIERHRRRMEWLGGLEGSPLVIRYEDVVGDAAKVADKISGELSIEFVRSELRKLSVPAKPGHVTAGSTAASVGRWRAELDPAVEARIREALRRELEGLGYEV